MNFQYGTVSVNLLNIISENLSEISVKSHKMKPFEKVVEMQSMMKVLLLNLCKLVETYIDLLYIR